MLIVRIKSGLGNQLFQYAFARSLSLRNNVQLKLDSLTAYKNDSSGRVYSLKHFNIKENLLSSNEINQIQEKGRFCRRIINALERRSRHYNLFYFLQAHLCPGCIFVYERELDFQQSIYDMKINKDIYFDGYWGSEKYFKDIEEIIRKEFTVKYEPDEQNQAMIKKILNSESVCLHIRRGDRVGVINFIGISSLEYYHKAIGKLIENISNPHFFIFSDDPQWTQKNMKLSFPTTYVNINGVDKDYEDLRLMSLCKHNIIANSTFSWWGAWLNTNPDKIVIAPKKWFADPIRNAKIKFEDLYPKEWIIL